MILTREQLEYAARDSDVSDLIVNEDYLEYTGNDGFGFYSRLYYYPEKINRNHIKNHMLIDPKVRNLINEEVLLDFLSNEIDKNALAVCEYIALIYDYEDEISPSRKKLQDKYDDEYALYACEDLLGLTWVERQIIFINVGVIEQVNDEIPYNDEIDFLIGILSTIFHEFRHLIYECHELLPFNSDSFPATGGLEKEVEEYGNIHAEATYHKYKNLLNKCYNKEGGLR